MRKDIILEIVLNIKVYKRNKRYFLCEVRVIEKLEK